jgi:hypothetical protein
MKVLGSIVASAILLLGYPVLTIAADVNFDKSTSSHSSVSTTTESGGTQTQSSTVSLDRSDLRQPHILWVQGEMNNAPIKMKRVEVKINGKVVKTITNGYLELNLAPMMTAGRYEVDISAISPRPDNTILLNFIGTHTQVKQQSSGSGKIDRKLIINIQ